MADWQLIEEGLKRGYSLDEVTDILAKEEGVDPSYARERGFDSPTILGRLGYAKPEATKPEKGFIGNVLDQAAHGVKTAYQGLLSAPGIYAGNPDAERIAGTIQAEQSHEKPKEMREAEAAFADVSKRQSDFESVYGKDSGYMDSIGKIMDMLVTTGKEIVTNPKGMAYEMASQSGNMVAPMVGAYAGGKTGAVTGALLGPKGAVAGGVVGAGAGGFAGSHVMEQSGEFRGKVAERLTELGLEPTAENVSAIFQDKAWLDKTLEETRDKATGTAVTDGVLAAIGGLAVNAPIRAAQKTARAQLGATATAKQVSDAASDILASQPKWQKVAPHLKAGAIGWGGEPISEAAGQQYGYGHIDYGDVGMEAFAAAGEGIGSVYAAAKGMRTNPTPPANVTPSPSITSAPTTDGAIKAFQDEVASVTPRGSFGSMDDLAGLIESERSDLGKRRGLLAQQQQDARDMENEFNGLVKDEQIDQSYRLNDAQQQRDAERARDGGYDLALQQREEQQGRTVEQQVAASEAQGFGEQEPTAMQLAMQLAKQKALDSEFDGLLKQERTSINELRANVKKVAGVPVESISTPQLEEIAQSEAHPNTKMAAVAALNDRHDAIQQERERLMQLRETRLERQSNQPEQGAQHGAESHEADGQVATPSVAGGGIDVPGGGFDAAMVASVGGVRGTAGAGAAVSRSGQVGAVPVADQPANVRALTENAAKRQATQLTNQGYPTAAYPHPTQAGMWAIGSQDEAKAATVPAPSATQNDVPPRQSASWVIRNKETGEVVMETFDRKKVDALNTAKYEAVPIREYLEGLNKRNESTAAEPPAVEVRSPVKRKLPASNNIAQAIINMGGVSTSLKNDILGDASIKTRPGLFTTNGTGDLGEIAAMLSSGFGFSQIDLNDPTDNSGAKQLADLIARSVNGETIHNEEAMIRAQQDEEFEQAKAEVNQQAAGLNIKPIRGKRTLEIVQAEINAILAEREEMTRRSREVQPLFDEVAEQELIDEFNLKVQEYHDENAIARADRAEESARLSAEESAQGDGDSVDQAAPSESRTSPTEGGRGEAEVTPEFGLVGQTEAEAISEQERLNQPEGLTKEQIDREAAAPFSLDGGTLAPEGAGVQGSMLTPDGRVSKDAEAKPAENKPTREFIGTGDKLYSESGRALAPAPKIETGTDRKINASTKRMNAWLLDEARKEAEANGNDWQQTLLRGIDANKMQKPDQDTVNDILFGDPDGPQAKHRAPHEGTVETPREAQSILKPLNPDAEAIAKADADFESALSDLGDIVGKSFRHNFTPEQEQKIIPVLTRLFDAAFRKGYYAFKDAARFVLDTIKAKFGVDIEEQITLQHMQGAYVGMSGRYRDQGVVRTDLSKEAAKAIDEYTFKKDGGYFIREKHLAALSDGVAMFSRGRGKLRSRPRGEITHETQRLEKEINRDLARQGQATIGAAGFITRSAVPDNAHRLVKAVEKLFGVRVEFVQVEDERANIFNGVFLGGNTLFVNVDSSSPISTVIGHEFLHFLKESNHDIYAKVEKDLLALANARKFAAAAIKHQPAMNAGEEVIADTFGDQFSNPEFWEELANRLAPSLFMRVRAAFTRFLGKLLGEIKATGTTHKTDALYSDLSAVRDAVLSATVEAANGRKLATPEWRSLHARFMTAWHGSPHDHDGFSMAHIGTGEGAQAYGYGLYFAGAREVAEGYRVALTSSAAKKQFDVAAALAAAKWFKSGMVVNGTTYYSRMDLQDDIAKQNLSSMHMPDEVRQVFADKLSERNGRLYQVELAPEQDEYLDSDKPLSEQSEKVKAALQAVEKQRLVGIIEKRKQRRAQLAEEGGDTAALDRQIEVLQEELDADALDLGGDGNNYYKSLSMKLGSDKAASKYLHSLGIRGIRYLDGSSRSAGEGNHNFVIFDDKDVKITAKESRSALSREAFAHNALQELATEDALFRYPVSKSASVDGVMREVFPGVEYYGEHTLPDERTETGADHRYVFRTPDTPAKDGRPEQKGKQFEVFTTDAGRVWVDVYRLQPGDQGSRVYAAVANYAHNARKVFGGDPVGVSPAAIIARTKMMLASALRFGTTRHLNAAREQEKGMPDDGIPPLEWRGNDIDKTRALIQNYLATVHSKAPAIRNYSYDFDTKRFVTNATGLEFHPSGPAFDAALGEDQRRAAGVGADSGRAAILIQSLVSKESGGIGDGGILQAILDDSRSLIEDGGLKGLFSMTTPANAGVSVSAPSESVRRIQAVVERFKQLFKGTSALDIRVVSTTFDIPARFRPSPFAEGVFHDDAGLVYLVTMNLRNQRGDVNEGRAWQVLLHEAVGHYGLSQMMGEKFAGILKAVKQATSTKGRVTDETRDTFQPGDKDYATWDAVKLRYPDASDSELAQEVLARMSETDPGSSVLGYAVATVRQWVRDVARAMGVNVMVSTSELRDLVAKASGYMRRGDNLADERASSGLVAASKSVMLERDRTMPTGLESRAATVQPQGAIWSAPEPSRTDNIIYTMQDKNIDLKRVQQAIKETVGEIRDDIDAYLQEELFHGRAAKITEEFLDKEVNPLISLMRAGNVSMEEMETFLWARHAKERNAQIAKINDEMPDGGSGLTDKQASDLMAGKNVTIGDKTIAGVKPARKKLLSDLAGRVDAITNGNRALLERYGLESAETLNAWDAAYQHYVPLHREDTDSHLAGMGTGQGYSVKGSSSKRATGSFRPVENIFANLALQRERIITRGEKNRVAQALHGLAKEMPNADLWEVDVKPTMRTTAMIGGREQVVDAVDPNFRNKPNVVFARFNGEDRFVVFNEHNERAVRMAEALKNLDADDISHLLGEVSRWTRYFASINTQYNPIFGVTNLVRDVQTGLLNLKSTPLDGKQMEMAGGLVHALPAVFKALRADRKGQSATGTWAQLWEEFQEVGGQTGYRDMFRNSHERAEALQNALDPAWWQKTWWGKAATVGGILAAPEQVFVEKVGKPFMELLSDYNTMMENGIRLSAYKLALDSGMTKERAASLAKNLTVNFNRKGQAGRQVGAMYAFFNASVQGTARMAETLNHGAKPGELLGKAGKQIVYGGLMLGALQAMLLLAAGFDDEEPPEFVRDRNIIIPTGNGKYISIPLPLGFHVLPTIGRISIEFTAGGFKKPGEHLVHIMDVLLDSFNPIGNAGLSMQTLAPTVLDPVAALTENKDWSGRQIARQDFSKLNPTPGYTRAKDTASSLSRGLAYALNYLSGGGEYGIGIVSPTPDQIEYLIGQVTGGVGRELGKVVTTGEAIGTGEDLPPHKIPLVGRFYGDTMGQSSEASKFYGTLEKLAEHKGALDRMKDAHASEAYQDYLRKHPESRLYGRAASVQREVANLRKLKRQLLDRGADRAKIRQVEDRMKAVMARFNQSASEHIRNQQ